MRARAPIAAALLLLLAGACVKPPPRTEPDIRTPVPDAWTAETDPAPGDVGEAWWRSFGDPQLDRLVTLALEQNRDLLAAASRVEQALERAAIAGAPLEPSIDVALDASRQKNNITAFGGAIAGLPGVDPSQSFYFNRRSASLRVSWEADLWGRLRAQARAALAEAQAGEADYAAAQLSLAGQTAKLWFAIAEAREQTELALRSAESFHDLSEQVRRRFERGVRPAIDLRLALSNEAAARAAVETRRQQYDAALRRLEVFLGDYPAADLLDGVDPRPLPDTPPPVPAGLPAEMVARRPDLLAAERSIAAADQRYRSARAALYPRLTLTASGGTASTALGDLLDGDFGVWTIAGGLVQPLFQGGRLRAEVRLADAAEDETLARYASLVLDAFREVETALAAESYLAREEQHLAEAARQLAAAEKLAEQRYRTGVGSYLEVLESQTRSFVAQRDLLTLRRARLTNRIDLHLALGGGFAPPDLAATRATAPASASNGDPS